MFCLLIIISNFCDFLYFCSGGINFFVVFLRKVFYFIVVNASIIKGYGEEVFLFLKVVFTKVKNGWNRWYRAFFSERFVFVALVLFFGLVKGEVRFRLVVFSAC